LSPLFSGAAGVDDAAHPVENELRPDLLRRALRERAVREERRRGV
jgi:hypothetical protein